jgi:hypothetical protein
MLFAYPKNFISLAQLICWKCNLFRRATFAAGLFVYSVCPGQLIARVVHEFGINPN